MSYRTMKLEDGEEVTMLRGAKKNPPKHKHRSDMPHAGVWGKERHYILVPCRSPRQVNMRRSLATSIVEGLEDRSSDAEVLLIGNPASIAQLMASGPSFCRALRRPKGNPDAVAGFRFTKEAG